MNHSAQPEYIFTPTGFLIENTENSESEVTQDCYRILYEMGTFMQPDNLTMSGYFLYRVAACSGQGISSFGRKEGCGLSVCISGYLCGEYDGGRGEAPAASGCVNGV